MLSLHHGTAGIDILSIPFYLQSIYPSPSPIYHSFTYVILQCQFPHQLLLVAACSFSPNTQSRCSTLYPFTFIFHITSGHEVHSHFIPMPISFHSISNLISIPMPFPSGHRVHSQLMHWILCSSYCCTVCSVTG